MEHRRRTGPPVFKTCGHKPAGVERPLSESLRSQQDWRAILRDFVAATTPSDYRWMPPNRRYIASGLYLPSVERRGLGEIVIAVDTSGSIGRLELEQFAAEISAISEETKPETIHVVYCDAAVQCAQQYGPSADPQDTITSRHRFHKGWKGSGYGNNEFKRVSEMGTPEFKRYARIAHRKRA